MKILIVTDAYPPMRTSAANLIYELGQAFLKKGHQVYVITNNSSQREAVVVEHVNGINLFFVKGFKTKDVNYLSRILGEFCNPFLIWLRLKDHKEFTCHRYSGVVWYSPTIFWGPLIKRIKIRFQLKSYLILRDIFPDWAHDLGLIKSNALFKALKLIELFQYKQADRIGVQSPNNLTYLINKNPSLRNKTEVLWNWVDVSIGESACSIDLSKFYASRALLCVYCGNMGVAQNINALLDLAIAFGCREDVGFVFVGRGDEKIEMMAKVNELGLRNIKFFDEIPSQEIGKLLQQCSIGLLSLDTRHTTHNIPGKFLTYLKCGLPIFAIVNPGNDLIEIVKKNSIGNVSTTNVVSENKIKLENLIFNIKNHNASINSKKLVDELFSSEQAVNLIKNTFTWEYCK